jgi:phosphoinositide-3-kinase regulatory subunit 4
MQLQQQPKHLCKLHQMQAWQVSCGTTGCCVFWRVIIAFACSQLPCAACRTLALRCVVQLMASLPKLPPADAKVYHDYLLPSLSLLPNDSEELVRVGYALAVAHLAAAAHEHLLGMQFSSTQQQQYSSSSSLAAAADAAAAAVSRVGSSRQLRQLESQSSSSSRRQDGSSTGGTAGDDSPAAAASGGRASAGIDGAPAALQQPQQQQQPLVRYDAEMAAVRSAVEKVVLDLVTGTRSSADIKRGLLSHTHQLGLFFGRKDINNVLLPLLITCLNAGEWQLRGSFFGAIAAVGPHTGRDSLDVFLLPCLEQVSKQHPACIRSSSVVVAGVFSGSADVQSPCDTMLFFHGSSNRQRGMHYHAP